MIAKVNIGGKWVNFGFTGSTVRPEPFYPYLIELAPIAEATGQETASTSFVLCLKAQELIDLNLRREVQILNKDLEVQFTGIIANIEYTEVITLTVEA